MTDLKEQEAPDLLLLVWEVRGRVTTQRDFTVTVTAKTENEAWDAAEEAANHGEIEWDDTHSSERDSGVEILDCLSAGLAPRAYATCPVCSVEIPLYRIKDSESFSGVEAAAHIVSEHPNVVTPYGVPYYKVTLLSSDGTPLGLPPDVRLVVSWDEDRYHDWRGTADQLREDYGETILFGGDSMWTYCTLGAGCTVLDTLDEVLDRIQPLEKWSAHNCTVRLEQAGEDFLVCSCGAWPNPSRPTPGPTNKPHERSCDLFPKEGEDSPYCEGSEDCVRIDPGCDRAHNVLLAVVPAEGGE